MSSLAFILLSTCGQGHRRNASDVKTAPRHQTRESQGHLEDLKELVPLDGSIAVVVGQSDQVCNQLPVEPPRAVDVAHVGATEAGDECVRDDGDTEEGGEEGGAT